MAGDAVLHSHLGSFTDFQAANFVCGAFDLTMTPGQRLFADGLVLSRLEIEKCTNAYFLPPSNRRHSDVSRLYAELRGLPPA